MDDSVTAMTSSRPTVRGVDWWAATAADSTKAPIGAVLVRGRHACIRQRRRLGGAKVAVLFVPRGVVNDQTGLDGGRWIVAHATAMAASRPPRTRAARFLTAVCAATAVAAVCVAVAGAGGVRLAGIVAAAVFGCAAAWLYRELWSDRCARIFAADVAATESAGAHAAVEALSQPQLYRTAAHQWWERHNPASTSNRLAKVRGT